MGNNTCWELEINCTRLRIRALEGDDKILYNIKDTVDLMIPAIQGMEDQNTIVDEHAGILKSAKSQRPCPLPISHPESRNPSVDDSAPALHTSEGGGSADKTVTTVTSDLSEDKAGQGSKHTADAAAAVVSCEGTDVDFYQRHASLGSEQTIPKSTVRHVTASNMLKHPRPSTGISPLLHLHLLLTY
jgi:hypothetical protein